MKKLTKSLLLVLAVAGGALTLTAFRHHGDGGHMERFFANRVEDMLDDVKATDAQRQQILAIKDKLVADGKALHDDGPSARGQLLALWKSDQPDAAKVHALVDARAAKMKAFADEVADAAVRVHAILTPEQRAVVTKKLERRMEE